MNTRIDGYMTEIKSLCEEYEIAEGQLETIYRLLAVTNKLSFEMRDILGFDGKAVENASHDRATED